MEGILQRIRKIPWAKNWIKESAEELERQTEQRKREAFFTELEEVKAKLRAVQSCFDAESDFDLIETYAMELCALEQRYSYLIKRAKKEKIRAY